MTLPEVRPHNVEVESAACDGELLAGRPRTEAAVSLRIENGISQQFQPVSVGVPFPRGALKNAADVALADDAGRDVPVQSEPLARWPDGSVRWLLTDFSLASVPRHGLVYTLCGAGRASRRIGEKRVRIEESREGIVADTGAATFHLDSKAFWFSGVEVVGQRVPVSQSMRIVLKDSKDRTCLPRLVGWAIETTGPVRTTLRFEGAWQGRVPLRFKARLSCFAGTGLVRLQLTIHNPRRARHSGGLWDLGDPGSMSFRDLSLELRLAAADKPRVTWTAESGQPWQTADGDLEIYQDSSGGDNWQSRNHVNRDGRVPCCFRGYRIKNGGKCLTGRRANPIVAAAGSNGIVTVAVPEFWQQFPKAIEVEGNLLRVRLFPQHFGDLFELQGGERKTHTVWLHFGPPEEATFNGETTEGPLDWVHHPATVHAAPAWYANSGACNDPRFVPEGKDGRDRLRPYLQEVLDGPHSFVAGRETIDEYGWRNYGEVYADHEGQYYKGPRPVISHFNNQYDMIQGALIQYLRTSDSRWLTLADPLARHVMDIDIYHTRKDKTQYNGGLFWFTDHYLEAATSTHRTYSRHNCAPRDHSYGGGPSSNHNFTTGLLYYYYLTGNPDARDAVVELADWVVNMEDGRKNLRGLIDDGPTGSATVTGDISYHGPGRGSGNSINALLDAWLLTGQRPYLDLGETFIRRTVHPTDDIAAHDLLNVEKRWSYPVFFVVVSRYLDLKEEAGEIDFMYAYARASLMHYARWVLDNERPYFDRPEQLEYPTETWAAQEFRKANVLRLAAIHAEEPLREKLLKRGEELADRAWSDLWRFDSRWSARAVALMMLNGTVDHFFRFGQIPSAPPLQADYDFGTPQEFLPQKLRVAAQLRSAIGILRAGLSTANPYRWLRLLRS